MTFEELIEKEYTAQSPEVSHGPPSRSKVQDLETILGVVRKINTSLVLSDVLELVVDEAIRITKADRGFLMLEAGNRKLEFVVGRNLEGRSIDADNFQVSSSVLEDVFTTGESICIENALTDERFERRQSIMDLELQTITCSPLRTQDETIGVIYVDSKFIHAVDKADILNFFEILAGQAAIAIKNARLYEDLKKSYNDLKQANEQVISFERMAMKGEIAGEVSHELKNLVAVVMLNLQVLQRGIKKITAEEIESIVDKTVDGAKKIQNFSQSLLTRSHASGNRLPASPNKLVREFVEFMQVVPKFKRNNVSSVLAEDLPDVELDIDQIQQVFLNLVTNAVEAFPAAAMDFTTEYDVEEGKVHLCVKDNGPGIDDSIRDRLFNEKITTKPDGHGYGLRICRQIMENHGGTIRIESEKDAGTKFIMTFPVADKGIRH